MANMAAVVEPTAPRLRALQDFCRIPVSVHFVFELVDKVARFAHWRDVIASQTGLGVWSLCLVIALLLGGSALLLFGPRRRLPLALGLLATFQVPTSVLFEVSAYETADSVSALGGVLSLAVLLNHLDATSSPTRTGAPHAALLAADAEPFQRLDDRPDGGPRGDERAVRP
jgi:hypothetical protein